MTLLRASRLCQSRCPPTSDQVRQASTVLTAVPFQPSAGVKAQGSDAMRALVSRLWLPVPHPFPPTESQ